MKPNNPSHFKALTQAIDPAWITTALCATGRASIRRRKMPAEQVVWLVIALAMYRHQSIPEVTAHLDLVLPEEFNPDIAKSALTQARQRMGDEPLAQLFGISAAAWTHETSNWRGLARYAMDGTTLRVPDSTSNRADFGAQAYSSGVVSSYPQVRMVTLTSLSHHLIRDAAFGAYGMNEMRYAHTLLPAIPNQSLTVLDRGFLSAEILLDLQHSGIERHWLIPAKANTQWERVDAHPTDYWVRMKVSQQARAKRPDLPEYWNARAIEVQSKQGNKRILLTSLLDKQRYPATEVAQQYGERWQIETSYRELKQSMLDGQVLRSGTPETVRQEVWGALLAYNLVRREMALLARTACVDAKTLSFTAALHYLRYEWGWMAITAPGKLPAHLIRLRERLEVLLLPRRVGRVCDRTVKSKPSKFPSRKVWRA